MRSARCLRSLVRWQSGAAGATLARLPGRFVVLVLCVVALTATMVGCSSWDSRLSVTAQSTATSSAPVATPTSSERLAALARRAFGGGVKSIEATYDAQSQTVKVTGTMGGDVPITASAIQAAQERTKAQCFAVQQVLWTSGIALRQAIVFVRGPIFDDYGNLYVDSYGTAVLGAATAEGFAWSRLSADSAWGHYDEVWLRPAYRPNWHYGAPPTATPSPTSGVTG